MVKSLSMKPVSATYAMAALFCVLLLIGGLDPWSASKCTLLTALISAPGVSFCRSYGKHESRSMLTYFSIGCCVGVGTAAVAQQAATPFGINFGWLLPQGFFVYKFLRSRNRGTTEVLRFELKHVLLIAATTALILSDTHWFFYLVAVVLFVSSRYQSRILYLLSGGILFLLSVFILPSGWHLTTNDRIFDSAYAVFIQRFGYWSWYGASDIWIPYHWLTHGIAGIYADVLNLDPYLSTGVIVPVLSALGIVVLVVSILHNYVSIDAAFKSALVVPLLGVIAAGTSISEDSSLVFGLAMVLFFNQTKLQANFNWSTFFVQALLTYLAFTAKVSTGMIAATAIGLIGLLNIFRKSKRFDQELYKLCAVSTGAAISLITTFNILSNDVGLSSRGRIVPYFGGTLFASPTWATANPLLVSGFILIAILGSVGLFVCVNRLARISEENVNADSKFLLASIIGGSLFFYGCIAYSAENYLSVGFWLAIPFVVGTVVSNNKILLISRKTIGLVGLIGAISGTIGYWMVQQSNVGDFFTAARIIGRGGLQLIVGILFVYAFSLLKRNTYKNLLLCIFLLSSLAGSDIYRISGLLMGRNVWDQGFENSKQAMFYGSTLESEAKEWILANSLEADLIATNHICSVNESCSLEGETPIAAWTQRRTLIEAERFITGRRVDETLFDEQTPRGHPDWVNERRETAINFADQPTTELLSKLKSWGVEWFWVDTEITQNRSWDGLATVRFSNAAVTVLQLD